jgi:hypothetical protein
MHIVLTTNDLGSIGLEVYRETHPLGFSVNQSLASLNVLFVASEHSLRPPFSSLLKHSYRSRGPPQYVPLPSPDVKRSFGKRNVGPLRVLAIAGGTESSSNSTAKRFHAVVILWCCLSNDLYPAMALWYILEKVARTRLNAWWGYFRSCH